MSERISTATLAVLTLQKALQRTAAGASIQPDDDLIRGIWVCRREEPEEKLRSVLRARDRQEAGVRLADVEVNIRDRTTIDGIFCTSLDKRRCLASRKDLLFVLLFRYWGAAALVSSCGTAGSA